MDLPELPSAGNFRDIAGDSGYRTPAGPLRRNTFLRSDQLSLTGDEVVRLSDFGLHRIIDLRAAPEAERRPDTRIPGAGYENHPVAGISRELAAGITDAKAARAVMIEHYRGFVTAPDRTSGFASALRSLSNGGGPQLVHCSAGKDRTGWVAMLLQSLAGVSEEDILADYLYSNDKALSSRAKALALTNLYFGERVPGTYAPLVDADAAYLEAGLEQLIAYYRDLTGYLQRGLGLTDDELSRLQAALVG